MKVHSLTNDIMLNDTITATSIEIIFNGKDVCWIQLGKVWR